MNGYREASALTESGPHEHHLDLATALATTPSGRVANPVFFTGFLARPDIAAAGILAVADVAGSRYADAGLGKRLANLDPVVTASGDRLRFESFSGCNGVYARLDLLPEALGSSEIEFGTTNVDINPPLRTALARVNRSEALHLSVGREELRSSSLSGTHVERKVELPDRWIRGLAEVPALSAAMRPVGQLAGAQLAQFLGGLPRVAPPGPYLHVLPMGRGWRTSTTAVSGSIPLPGASRLRGSDRVVRHARGLSVHAADNGTTAWVFELPDAVLTLVISPDPYRGFSGEGTLLTLLSDPDAEHHGRRLLAELGWGPVVDPDALGASTGLSTHAVSAGLAWLGASGRLGYDLTARAWFHRELPVDSELVLRRHPRLTDARELVESDAVSKIPSEARWLVRGSRGRTYDVVPDDGRLRCGCTWELEHAGGRGPCKHTLAVLLTLQG